MGNPSCTCCGNILDESAPYHSPQAVVIGTFPVLYKGVVCLSCGQIECTICKGERLQAPCSSCGGRVTPATQDALKNAPRKEGASSPKCTVCGADGAITKTYSWVLGQKISSTYVGKGQDAFSIPTDLYNDTYETKRIQTRATRCSICLAKEIRIEKRRMWVALIMGLLIGSLVVPIFLKWANASPEARDNGLWFLILFCGFALICGVVSAIGLYLGWTNDDVLKNDARKVAETQASGEGLTECWSEEEFELKFHKNSGLE